ncbi:18420_t:CDS:2, partial [Entrophospora sp. SA101]
MLINATNTIGPLPKKKQYVVPEMSHFFPNEDVPMQANGSVNILEVVKSA